MAVAGVCWTVVCWWPRQVLSLWTVLPVTRAVLASQHSPRSGACPAAPATAFSGAARFALLRGRWALLLSHRCCVWLPGGAGHGGQNCPRPCSCSVFGDVSPKAVTSGLGVWDPRVLSGPGCPRPGRASRPRLPGALCPLPGRHQTVGVGRRPLVLACVALVTKGRPVFLVHEAFGSLPRLTGSVCLSREFASFRRVCSFCLGCGSRRLVAVQRPSPVPCCPGGAC